MHTLITRPARALGLSAAAVLLVGGLAACGEESDSGTATDATSATGSGTATTDAASSVVVGDPWVRATAGTEDTSMTAAFMTIDNTGDEDVTLVGASSEVAGMVEIHEMLMVDGAMAMQAMDAGLVIEAGRGKVLEPGGYHVMLMDVQTELAPGDEVALTLEFSDGSTEDLTVPVKEFTEEEGHYHEPGTDEDHSHGDEDEMDSDDKHGDEESSDHSH
ncbi:copper chaperone PCu(A)C [uncultured Nocardioides sp.]|uniref:copper chaperone PCu(A)C n=1 Tax=uncultured Nocardioides sp. TaxID=198441 RepID=UPI00262B0C90|nr:copper chaperone PCu(A)C [uncultured Nocardioides sp.]